MSAPRTAPLDTLILPAHGGLRFVDACSRMPVLNGLRCSLRRRRDGRLIGIAASTPSGVHHWPALAAHWLDAMASPPASSASAASAASGIAEVLVEDTLDRYLSIRLPWPPTADAGQTALTTTVLCAAPQRNAPAGTATLHALLADAAGAPAAWARVLVTDAQSRSTPGMSDADGRLTLHLPFPRPDRRPNGSPPNSPPNSPPTSPPAEMPAAATRVATASLRVFHAAALAIDAAAHAAPWLPDWQAQPEVRAVARIGTTESFGPLCLVPERPCVPVTEGLAANRSELRLTPF